MVDLALNVMAAIFLVVVALIAIGIVTFIGMRLLINHEVRKLQKRWKAAVGDVVVFHSMAGPVNNLVTEVLEDGRIMLYSKSYSSSGTKCVDPSDVTFTGKRGVEKNKFWS